MKITGADATNLSTLVVRLLTKAQLTMLVEGLNDKLERISGSGNLQEVSFQAITAANNEGWIDKFLDAFRKMRPNDPDLSTFVGSLTIVAPAVVPVPDNVERPASPALLNRLLNLTRAEFERLLLLASVPQQELPVYAAGQDARARAAARFLDLQTVDSLAAILTRNASLGTLIRARFWKLIARVSRRLYDAARHRRWIAEPIERRALEDYNANLAERMKAENSNQLIEQKVGVVNDSDQAERFRTKTRAGIAVHRIRHLLRSLSGIVHGGDQQSAQLASLHRRSRVVRDAVATLLNAEQPVILLGEPGSGKSMTLREVARDLVLRESIGPRPPVVVFARLGMYRTVKDDAPGDVVEFIRLQIPPEYESIRNAVPTFIAEGRLIVLFDGMDEMERRRYNDRVRVLSRFASEHEQSVTTLFSCRINDFTPEFTHHQLVLLPFGDSQVAEFVRKNLPLPLTIDSVEYKRHAHLLRDLRARPGLSDLVNNPLMLTLARDYLVVRERWPQTRAALFRNFIEEHLEDLREAKRVVLLESEPDSLFADWAAIGFNLISRGAGDVDDAAFDPRLIDVGILAGLLQRDPDERERIRFTHHRFKEFFAALHISSAAAGMVDWKEVLDEAGWQETLLNLVSIDPANEAIDELQESIVEGLETLEKEVWGVRSNSWMRKERSSDWLGNAEGERAIADRVVLASHIIREIGAERAALSDDFEETFYRALSFLARWGRPTSQVKMLWAWKNAPGPSVAESLAAPIDSDISWVRDQAIILVAAVGGTDPSRNIGIELAADLASERVLNRLPTYSRAVRGSARWTFAALVAAFCHAGILAVSTLISVVMAVFATDIASQIHGRFISDTTALLIIAALAIVLVPMLRGTENSLGTARCLIFATFVVCFIWSVLWAAIEKGLIGAVVVGFGVLIFVAWVPGSLSEIVFWFFTLLFAAVLNVVESSQSRSTALRISRASPAVAITWGITGPAFVPPLVSLVLGLIGAGVMWVGKKLGGGWEVLLLIAKWSVLAIPAALALAYVITMPFTRLQRTRERIASILHSVAPIALYVVFFIWGIPLLRRLFRFLAGLFGGGWVLGLSIGGIAVIVLALCTVVISHYAYFLKGILVRARGRQIRVDEWRAQMATGDAAVQREYLRVDRSQFAPKALTASEYLDLLADVERFVKSEPSAGEYWRQRQQMEQAVRQDRRGE